MKKWIGESEGFELGERKLKERHLYLIFLSFTAVSFDKRRYEMKIHQVSWVGSGLGLN